MSQPRLPFISDPNPEVQELAGGYLFDDTRVCLSIEASAVWRPFVGVCRGCRPWQKVLSVA
jgi:hypothetical protein